MGAILCGGALAQQETPAVSENQPITPLGNESTASNSQDDTKEEKAYHPELLRALDGIQSAIHSLVPEKDEVSRQRQEQREYADLEAQQSMAWATYWLMWIGAGGLALTAVGVGLIWRTLVHTRRAANAAVATVKHSEQTVTAALDSIKINRESAVLQLRAYVVIQKISFFSEEKKFRSLTAVAEPKIEIIVKNTGQTPAKKVNIKSTIYKLNDDHTKSIVSGLNCTYGEIEGGLFINETIEINSLYAAYIKNGDVFYVEGMIKYIDVFDIIRSIIFKYHNIKSPDGQTLFVPYDTGNHST